MVQGIYLYFDYFYEFDLEERGFYWVCRFCDIRKIFGFMLDNIYVNVDVKLLGDLISMEDLLFKYFEDYDFLKKYENILGSIILVRRKIYFNFLFKKNVFLQFQLNIMIY